MLTPAKPDLEPDAVFARKQRIWVDVLAGQTAVITSALPLTEADQATYRSYLQERLGQDATVEFRTDPDIMGGVVLRVGDMVVDDSVSGKMSALRQTLG